VSTDPIARRLAAAALAVALVALVLAGWASWRIEGELHDLRRAVERAVDSRSPSLGPPLQLDEAL